MIIIAAPKRQLRADEEEQADRRGGPDPGEQPEQPGRALRPVGDRADDDEDQRRHDRRQGDRVGRDGPGVQRSGEHQDHRRQCERDHHGRGSHRHPGAPHVGDDADARGRRAAPRPHEGDAWRPTPAGPRRRARRTGPCEQVSSEEMPGQAASLATVVRYGPNSTVPTVVTKAEFAQSYQYQGRW